MLLVQIRRTSLYAGAATLSAVLSDWSIEGSAARGVFGHAYVEHDHRNIECTLTAGIIFLLAALLLALAEKARCRFQGNVEGDWLAEAAHDISQGWSWRALAQSLLFALAVRYTMESARVIQEGGGHAASCDWLGGPTVLALAIHGFFCAFTFFGLVFLMRGLDRTIDRIVRIVAAIFVTLARHLEPKTHFLTRDALDISACAAFLARLFGDRAPPLGLFPTP